MNKKLLVQDFLKDHTFKELEDAHGVFASFSKDGTKFSLNYDQILAKDSDPIVQQCRGLILRMSDKRSLLGAADTSKNKPDYSNLCPGDTEILAYPMNRFFNYGQGAAANINWNDPELCTFEKLDGTLCILYFDDIKEEWHVATRSVPEADIPLEFNKFTFRSLFEKGLLESTGYTFADYVKGLKPGFTYCYELTSPYNRIVVSYKDCSLHVLAVRNNLHHTEFDDIGELARPVLAVEKYSLKTIDDIIALVNSKNPMEHEGIVIRDSNFNRIKVKNAAYVAYNRARDSLGSSTRACLEIVMNEKADDVISFMPEEISKTILDIQEKLSIFIKEFDTNYLVLSNQTNALVKIFPELAGKERKVFANLVENSNIWKSPCFEIFIGRCSNIKDYIKSKSKDGSWSNGIIDVILKQIGYI